MDRLRRNHGWQVFVIVMCLAAAFVGVLSYRYVFVQDQINQNKTALAALCALREDLDARIASSKDFLELHPNGLDGLSRTVIQSALRNSLRTRQALKVLDCKGHR